MTGSLGVGLEFADEQKIEATGIYLRNTEDDASITTGNNVNFRQSDGRQLRNHRVRYEERELELVQLRGTHRLGPETMALLDGILNLEGLEDLAFDWYWSDAKARTDLPSEVQYSFQDTVDPDTGEILTTSMRLSATAAEYRYTDLEDTATSYGTKFSFPLKLGTTALELTAGYDYYEKGRGYLQTQLNLGSTTAPASVVEGTPAEVFTDANILEPANGFGLTIGAVIAVDLFGLPADYPRINRIANKCGAIVIEDVPPNRSERNSKAKKHALWHPSAAPPFSPPSLWDATATVGCVSQTTLNWRP